MRTSLRLKKMNAMTNPAVPAAAAVSPPRVRKRSFVKVKAEPEEAEPIAIGESLSSYDAIAVYFSFGFHLMALAAMLLVLWMLDLFYLQTDTVVDPLRAALAEEVVLDDAPLMEELPLQLAAPETIDIPQDSAVAIAEAINDDSLSAPVVPDVIGGSEGGEGTQSLNVWLPKGGNAVTKGSFTAWTDPENPTEGSPYAIIIEVKLPARVKIYRLTDLTGKVVGTDNYTQRLPWDNARGTWPYMFKNDREYRVGRTQRIRVRDNKIQTKIKVPGASNLVRDQITIRSETLDEKQELELVFGREKRPRRRMNPGGQGGAGGKGGGGLGGAGGKAGG